MVDVIRILGICGSLRSGSLNRAALRAAADVSRVGSVIEIADLAGMPLYNEDVREQGTPHEVEALAGAIAAANAVLIATPEYNYSISGVLKNALDWVSKAEPQPFRGKPVAIMGASPELSGTSLAQHHLRQILVCLNARVLAEPEVMIGAAGTKFDAEGRLTDEKTRVAIGKLMRALVEWTHRLEE